MEKLPNELIQDIIQRSNPDEIRGLCNSNSMFRKQCNQSSKYMLKQMYRDFYELYLSLQQFYICITTNDGETKFINVNGINNVPDAFIKLISQFEQRMQRDIEISWSYDNHKSPKMVSINFHYYSDIECTQTFDVIIQGNFKNFKKVQDMINQLTKQFEQLQ